MIQAMSIHLANHIPHSRPAAWLRRQLLTLAGMKIGQQTVIRSPVSVTPNGAAESIRIGRRCYLGSFVRFGGRGGVSIGDFVQIAAEVSFDTASHPLEFTEGEARPTILKPIRVEDHVWIGTGVKILSGVTIGRGAVIAAGAVVTEDVPPMTLAGGIPARVIRQIEPGTSPSKAGRAGADTLRG